MDTAEKFDLEADGLDIVAETESNSTNSANTVGNEIESEATESANTVSNETESESRESANTEILDTAAETRESANTAGGEIESGTSKFKKGDAILYL